MFDLGNVEFKYMEKGTRIGEIVNSLVKDLNLNNEKLEIKEFDLSEMPLVVRLLTKNVFDLQYDGESKLMVFVNNDYDIKLGMNSGIIDLSLLKHLTKFLIELNRRIKKYAEDIKDVEKKLEKTINRNKEENKNDSKDGLAKLLGEMFLEILGDIKDGE